MGDEAVGPHVSAVRTVWEWIRLVSFVMAWIGDGAGLEMVGEDSV